MELSISIWLFLLRLFTIFVQGTTQFWNLEIPIAPMTFKEIASKITGISFPIFGVSWSPSKSDIELAREVINFLEDRRVLYNAYELENPDHCYQSVIKIRDFLTKQLNGVNRGGELDGILRGMRGACRKVLDEGGHNYDFRQVHNRDRFGFLDSIGFFSAIGVFRGTMGVLIARMVIMFGIDFEESLLSIIPTE